jgi:hypothetical protein
MLCSLSLIMNKSVWHLFPLFLNKTKKRQLISLSHLKGTLRSGAVGVHEKSELQFFQAIKCADCVKEKIGVGFRGLTPLTHQKEVPVIGASFFI